MQYCIVVYKVNRNTLTPLNKHCPLFCLNCNQLNHQAGSALEFSIIMQYGQITDIFESSYIYLKLQDISKCLQSVVDMIADCQSDVRVSNPESTFLFSIFSLFN